MRVELHPHAKDRLRERGATETEVVMTVTEGEPFPAKHGRQGFRRNFAFHGEWNGTTYATKQVEVYAVEEANLWLVITVIVKYF